MAVWCLVTRQTPATYRTLTRLEREAFLTVLERARDQ